MRFIALLLLAFLAPCPAQAAVEKIAIIGGCKGTICFHWWPVLPKIEGWHQDREQSVNYSINALAPDGYTFANAATVMYALAIYKPQNPETKSLATLIEKDKKEFIERDPGMTITEASPIATADGQKLKSFTFFPKAPGNWERVSYGQEGDFYLVFTISSRSEADLQKDMPAYEKLIENYQEQSTRSVRLIKITP